MIEITGLCKQFSSPRGKTVVFDDFSLAVADGEFLGVTGKSGAGKSTLLSIIAGLQKPDSGNVRVADAELFSLSDDNLSQFRNRNIGFVSQEQSFLENLTVLDNVRLPHFLFQKEEGDVTIRALSLLEKFGIKGLSNEYPMALSGGENHRVLIARALINNPPVLLADEPTGNVDREQTQNIIRLFRQLADEGKTVVLVSHDEQAVSLCDRVIAL